MIRLDKLKIFPYKTSEIYWPGSMSTETPLNFVFFPENANFNMAFRKLKIPRRFVKHGTLIPAMIPRLMYTRDLVSQYLLFKLIPIRNVTPAIKNLFIDTDKINKEAETHEEKFEISEENDDNCTILCQYCKRKSPSETFDQGE